MVFVAVADRSCAVAKWLPPRTLLNARSTTSLYSMELTCLISHANARVACFAKRNRAIRRADWAYPET
jgi:hypothetical protein